MVNGQVASLRRALSKCPSKCKIGKLEVEMREKIDNWLVMGSPYREIIETFQACKLNAANLSAHKNQHLHPFFRSLLLV